MHKVGGFVWLWRGLRTAVDVGQQRTGRAVAQVCNLVAKWFDLIVGEPLGEFGAADFTLGLRYAFAEFFG